MSGNIFLETPIFENYNQIAAAQQGKIPDYAKISKTELHKEENIGGIKNDSDKPDYSLLPLDLCEGFVRVFQFGANKYSRDNFRQGFQPHRLIAASLRHLTEVQAAIRLKDLDGEAGFLLDKESGLAHVHHAICSLLILVDSMKKQGFEV